VVRPLAAVEEMFLEPERAAWWADAYRRCVELGTLEERYEDAGRVFDVSFQVMGDWSGRRATITVYAHDVTTEVAAVAALAASEMKYRSIVEAMAEGVVFQAPDGRIVETNRAALEIEGRTETDMIGRTSEDETWEAVREDGSPFPGEEHPSMVTLRTGEPQHGVVMGLRRGDGSQRWISINSQPVRMRSDTEPVSVVTTFHDITDRKEVRDQLADMVCRLEGIVESTLRALAVTVEVRDAYTSGHMDRVAQLADRIALELGWPEERRRVLHLAASVHDVGKIAIPLEILTKPARLTAIELDLVRSHSAQGHRILSEIDFGAPIAEIVHQHHERIDGCGYPQGLRGEEILPEARILAVADVVESMAAHRPYRPALGLEAALAEIRAGAGHQYEAEVVEVVVGLAERGALRLGVTGELELS
jgi:PAS domain S-box-containing protein